MTKRNARALESYGPTAAWVKALPNLGGDWAVLPAPELQPPQTIDIDDIEFRAEIEAFKDQANG